MAEEPPDSARLRPKSVRVGLTQDGREQGSVRQHTAGSGVVSEDSVDPTSPANDKDVEDARSEAYSEDSPPSVVSENDEGEETQAEDMAPIPPGPGDVDDRLGTPSEVEELEDPAEDQPASVRSASDGAVALAAEEVEASEVDEVAPVADVASVGSDPPETPLPDEDESAEAQPDMHEEAPHDESPPEVNILILEDSPFEPEPVEPPSADPQESGSESPAFGPWSTPEPSQPSTIVPTPKDPDQDPKPETDEVLSDPETEGDPYYEEDQFESSAPQSASDSEEEVASEPEVPAPDTAEEKALKSELAMKDDEQEKLAAQMRAMQQEMGDLRRLVEQQQKELANSSQELQKALAEVDALRKEQADSARSSKAEKDANKQVDKLMKERKSLNEQLEKLQEQMTRMESLQEKLQQRLRATELERDAIRQRLQAESAMKKPHRIEEAEEARRRTGGEFQTLEKPAGQATKRPRRRERSPRQRRPSKRLGRPSDVWCFQPRSKGTLAIRVLPSLDAPRSGQKILPGDAFMVSEKHKGPSKDMVFLKLADGRGWAFNRSPDVGTLCVPRPAGKDPLAPYRLPEGSRLPGKIRQDHVTTHLARPRLPMIPKPVRDNRVPWH